MTFNDGTKWGIKRAPGVGFVYFEIRAGRDVGLHRFNYPSNDDGHSPSAMKQYFATQGLAQYWAVFWRTSKLKGT